LLGLAFGFGWEKVDAVPLIESLEMKRKSRARRRVILAGGTHAF
jgi:hypothetical protein